MRPLALFLLALSLLTPGPLVSQDPGPWVVFTSQRTGKGDLYVTSLGTGALTRLTSASGKEDQPAWSFDGSTIAYRRGGNVWTVQADGSHATNRTPDTPSSQEQFPFWFPDGRLGFTSDRSGVQELYVLAEPSWIRLGLDGRKGKASPDGTAVCYTRDLEVYRAELDDPVEVNLTRSPLSDHDCAWSPTDPDRLLVHSHRDYPPLGRMGRIWLIDRDGDFQTPPVTPGVDDAEGDAGPNWHASGWIVWERHVGCTREKRCLYQREKLELFGLTPEGDIVRLTSNAIEDSQASFRP
jgi:hypothetical protein